MKSYQIYLKCQSNYVLEIHIDQIYFKIFTIEFKDEGNRNVESIFFSKGNFSFQMEEIH